MNREQVREFRRSLLRWYANHKRDLPWRGIKDPYRIWVSEVMLQQTQVSTVVPYFEKFVAKYPDVATLARANLEDILKSWERLGYYARARHLHEAARRLASANEGRIPDDYEAFRRLPGVGDYTAAAVMSLAFDQPWAVVDGNVKRLISRFRLIEAPAGSAAAKRRFQEVADELLDRKRPGEFNQAMMELGGRVCRSRNPLCGCCPVANLCQAFAESRQEEFPVRRKRRAIPEYHIALGVIHKGDRILITRRKEEGHLGGLWEFPGGKVRRGEAPQEACKREISEEVNLTVTVTDYLTRIDHAYSHFRIAVDVYTCQYKAGKVRLNGPIDYRWILVDEIDDYPFPGANHKFLPLVKKPDS